MNINDIETYKQSVMKAIHNEMVEKNGTDAVYLHEPTCAYISADDYLNNLCKEVIDIIESIFRDEDFEQFEGISPETWASNIVRDCLSEECEYVKAVVLV